MAYDIRREFGFKNDLFNKNSRRAQQDMTIRETNGTKLPKGYPHGGGWIARQSLENGGKVWLESTNRWERKHTED